MHSCHKKIASVGTVAFRVCGIVDLQKQNIGGLLAVKVPGTADSIFTSMILNHRPSSTIIFFILVFNLLCTYSVASQAASCDVSIYGKPDKSDCRNLFEKFTSSQNLQAARFFDEEQLRADSDNTWPGVANVFQQPIVQLPKFFAMSMPILCTAVV